MTETVHIRGSLRNQLAITFVRGAALLAVLIFIIVRSYAAQIAQQGQDDILGASVTSILDAAVIRNGAIEIDFPYASFSMLNTESDDRVFYAIYQDDKLLSGYPNLPRASVSAGMESDFRTELFDATAIRLATASRVLIGAKLRTNITVSVAQTQDALSGTLNRISRNVGLFGTGFFLLTTLLSVWVTSTTITPLRRLTNSVTRRGPQDLSPVVRHVPAEMAPLVSSLNNLMARLDQSLKQSEDFIAEAAHRVRTPLATVRSHAEATLHRVEREDNRKALRAMMRAIDESSRAAGQLLDHAMITFRADHLELHKLNLVDVVSDLVTRLSPIAEMKHIELHLHGDMSVVVYGDPILLQNAFRNIIDNALKYAPSESGINIFVHAKPRPTVEIQDQGTGFPPNKMSELVARFSRGENAKDTIGSGLGLTIAQDVATAHKGTLTLSNLQRSGACVTFSF